MYTSTELPSELREAFEAVEAELNTSIRVYRGSTLLDAERWREEFPESLIFVMYSTPTGARRYRDHYFNSGEVLRDIPMSSSNDPVTEYEGGIVGCVQPRIVWDFLGLQRFAAVYVSLTEERIDTLIRQPLIQASQPDFAEAHQRATRERERAALVEFAQTTHNQSIRQRRNTIDSCATAMSAHRTNLARTIRNLRREQELLDALLLLQANDAGGTVVREWDQLREHPRVGSLAFAGNSLVITTTDDLRLHREDTGASRWLGAFRITISLDSLTISINNLNTRRGGRDHPHIADGEPCFGAHETTFAELLGRGELYTLYELLLQYLETLNLTDSWGSFGSYWFDVEDERPITEVEEAIAA